MVAFVANFIFFVYGYKDSENFSFIIMNDLMIFLQTTSSQK